MKIPNNKILAVSCVAGMSIAAMSIYWIRRRDELSHLITIAKRNWQNGGFLTMQISKDDKRVKNLFVQYEEIIKDM